MDRMRKKKLGKILVELGLINPEHPNLMKPFANRLIFQKTIYILKCINVGLDYSFNWYLRGPYCSPLAADGFFFEDLMQKFDAEKLVAYFTTLTNELSSEEVESIQKWQELQGRITSEIGLPITGNLLEFIASIAFIANETFSRCRGNLEETKVEIQERKPGLYQEYKEHYDAIFNFLLEYGVIHSK